MGTLASCASLSSLEVKAGAKFTLETDVADPLAGLRELVVSDTSAVTLPAGTSCTLNTFKINGQKLFDGTYPGVAYDWLLGDDVTFTVKGSEWTKADIEALTEGVAIPAGGQLVVRTAHSTRLRARSLSWTSPAMRDAPVRSRRSDP